jgi:hypothetical protein
MDNGEKGGQLSTGVWITPRAEKPCIYKGFSAFLKSYPLIHRPNNNKYLINNISTARPQNLTLVDNSQNRFKSSQKQREKISSKEEKSLTVFPPPTTTAQTGLQAGMWCPNCGAALEGRKCKLFCPTPGCGYLVTCSEW